MLEIKFNLTSELQLLESTLKKHNYLSKEDLPNGLDGRIFLYIQKMNIIPNRQQYPFVYHWFIIIKQFANKTVNKWIQNDPQEYRTNSFIKKIAQIDEKFKKMQKQTDENSSSSIKEKNNNQENLKKNSFQKYSMVVRIKRGSNIPNYKHKNYFIHNSNSLITKYEPSEDQKSNKIIRVELNGIEEQWNSFKNQIIYWSQVEGIQIKKGKNIPRLYTL